MKRVWSNIIIYLFSLLFFSCATHRKSQVLIHDFDSRNLVETTHRDSVVLNEVLRVKDVVRVKDSCVLVMDTLGTIIKEFHCIHEYAGRDTIEKIIYQYAALDSSARMDSVRCASIEKDEVVKEKKRGTWKIWAIFSLVALVSIGLILFDKKRHG